MAASSGSPQPAPGRRPASTRKVASSAKAEGTTSARRTRPAKATGSAASKAAGATAAKSAGATSTTKTGRPARAQRPRHDEVLEVALGVFAQRGYRATTLEDIAREMGFTPAALYYYVSSKQALLSQISFRPMELLTAEIERQRSTEESPAQKLREIICAHTRIITEQQDWFIVMLRDQNELPDDQRDALRRQDRTYHHQLRRLIEEAVAAGEMSADEPGVTALMIIGAMNWTIQWYRPDGRLNGQQLGELIADTFIPKR
jgi:AcrR family transcriptional regulator